MRKPDSTLENETHKVLWDFDIQTDHLNSAQTTGLINNAWCLVDFAVPADHRVKIKESEIIHKYLYLARELKKLWNVRVIVIQTVVGMLETILKGLKKRLENLEIRGRIENIKIIALLRSTRILRKVQETCRDLQSLRLQ